MGIQQELRDLKRKGAISSETYVRFEKSIGVSSRDGADISLLQVILAALAIPVGLMAWSLFLISLSGNPVGKVKGGDLLVVVAPIVLFSIPIAVRQLAKGFIAIAAWGMALAPVLGASNFALAVMIEGVWGRGDIYTVLLSTMPWALVLLLCMRNGGADIQASRRQPYTDLSDKQNAFKAFDRPGL